VTVRPLHWLIECNEMRVWVALQAGLAGMLVSTTAALTLHSGGIGDGFVLMASTAGLIGGFIFSGWYGRQGLSGWVFSTLASFLVPVLGGAIVGTVYFPGFGTVLGALYAAASILTPPPFLVWILCLFAMHLVTRSIRSRLETAS